MAQVRKTEGKWIPNGRFVEIWKCSTCEGTCNTGTGTAPDGDKGLWCIPCANNGVKGSLQTVQIPDVDYVRGYTEVLCCGDWLMCDRFTNTCGTCNRDYNGSGQELAPRSQWGEETGESATDILNIDAEGY